MAVSSISAAENLSLKKVGRIDALANNTGMNDGVGFEKRTSNQFIASLQRNLLHYGNMAHCARPHLKHTGGSKGHRGSPLRDSCKHPRCCRRDAAPMALVGAQVSES